MEPVTTVVDGMKHYDSLLRAKEQEPDPARYQEPTRQAEARKLLESLRKDLLDAVPAALAELEQAEQAQLKADVADTVIDAAGLLVAAGASDEAANLLSLVAEYVETGTLRELLDSRSELENLRQFVHVRWHLRNKNFPVARKMARTFLAQTSSPLYKRLAQQLYEAPEPLDGAPTLYTVNGIGTTLYGRRDERSDGTYVATLCFCLLFVPVIPISAYRVLAQEQGWIFLGKVPLSGFAQMARRLVLLTLLLGSVAIGVAVYYDSNGYRSGQALAAAQGLEKGGKSEEAARAYAKLLSDFGSSNEHSTLASAAESLIRLRLAELPSPMTATGVDRAASLVQRLETLPAAVSRPAASRLATALQERAQQLSSDKTESVALMVRLHELIVKIASGEQKTRSEAALTKLRRDSAGLLAVDWPVSAARIYMKLGEAADIAAAVPLLQRLLKEPLLLWQERVVVKQFIEKAQATHAELCAQLRQTLADAEKLETDTTRSETLVSGNAEGLQALLASNRWDQDAAIALSAVQFRQGKLTAAWQQLGTIAPPGLLVREGQRLYASAAVERGDLKVADQVLTRYLEIRMPEFQAARQQYAARDRALREKYIADARAERLPEPLMARLGAAKQEDQPAIFSEWLNQQLASDAEHSSLLEAYRGYADVVPASVTMGTLKLREAQSSSGEPREKLLKEAEQTFLSIGSEAEGSPEFHLGLGQVYHRLGKAKEGDAEFGRLLAGTEYPQHLAVGRAYRELGLIKRAQEVQERVFEKGNQEERDQAAIQLSLMARTEEENWLWLSRASQNLPFVKRTMLQLEGDKLLRQGKLKLADAKYAQVVEEYRSSISTNPSAANNAALVLQSRYMCTGDPKFLSEGVQMLDAGLRQEADSPLLMGNLAALLHDDANVRVLGRYIHVKDLQLTSNEAELLIDSLLDGPQRTAVLEALSSDVAMRRTLELAAQREVLAPGSIGPFEQQLDWLRLHNDIEGLRSLLNRAQRVKSFDNAAAEESQASYLAGKNDEKLQESLSARCDKWKETLARVQRAGHKPTEAAVRLLLAGAQGQLFHITQEAALAQECLAENRRASATWNGFGLHYAEAVMLIHLAALEIAAQHPDFGKTYAMLNRTYRLSTLLFVLERDHLADYARLKQNPRVTEAAKLLKIATPETMPDAAYGLGAMSGDSELQTAGRRHLESERSRLSIRLRSLLNPNNKDAQATSDLLNSLGR